MFIFCGLLPTYIWFTAGSREHETGIDPNLTPVTSISVWFLLLYITVFLWYEVLFMIFFLNIYVKWKQTQNKNILKQWLLTKTKTKNWTNLSLKYSVIFIWHAHDTIDQKQDNQGNSVPVGDIFNFFFTFLGDRTLCLSFFVQITYELKYEESYCLSEELDWVYLSNIKIHWNVRQK